MNKVNMRMRPTKQTAMARLIRLKHQSLPCTWWSFTIIRTTIIVYTHLQKHYKGYWLHTTFRSMSTKSKCSNNAGIRDTKKSNISLQGFHSFVFHTLRKHTRCSPRKIGRHQDSLHSKAHPSQTAKLPNRF
jgi:hypothetical protein